MRRKELERRIERIKAELQGLGAMHPGSIGKQYNVCGTPGCRCKDKKRPKKHGPYYQLSFTWRSKSGTRFIQGGRLEEMRRKVSNYRRFRELTREWVDISMELERLEKAGGGR